MDEKIKLEIKQLSEIEFDKKSHYERLMMQNSNVMFNYDERKKLFIDTELSKAELTEIRNKIYRIYSEL